MLAHLCFCAPMNSDSLYIFFLPFSTSSICYAKVPKLYTFLRFLFTLVISNLVYLSKTIKSVFFSLYTKTSFSPKHLVFFFCFVFFNRPEYISFPRYLDIVCLLSPNMSQSSNDFGFCCL